MQIDNNSHNSINALHRKATNPEPGSGKNQGQLSQGIDATQKTADKQVRPMRSYKGHGMLEQYPANLTLAYVSGHERKHAHKNRSEAGLEGKKLEQNISYNVQISSGGKAIASGGVTKSQSSAKGREVEKIDSSAKKSGPHGEAGLLSPKLFEKKIKEFHLNRKKESLESELRESAGEKRTFGESNDAASSKKPNPSLSNFSGKNSNHLSENLEKTNIRLKLSHIEREKKEISQGEQIHEATKNVKSEPKQKEGNAPEITTTPLPEEEHVDLSRVAPSSYHFMKRGIPNAALTHGFGAAFEMNNILNRRESFSPNRTFSNSFESQAKPVKNQLSALDNLASHFQSLKTHSQELSSHQAFNVRTAKSSARESISAQTTSGSPTGRYQVSVNAIAQPHKVVSDEYSDPYAALGLSGSFKINGYEVTVETSDSLGSIMDKINYGEDVNQNGSLDYAEDLNANGSLDTFQIDNTTSYTFIHEDVDFDETLDTTEDVNGNEILDGGTSQLGVKAEIQFDRLMISTVNTGNRRLNIEDTDDILLSLGVQFENNAGEVKDTAQFGSSGTNQLNSSASFSSFSVNGQNYQTPSNRVNNVVPNTSLNLKDVTVTPAKLDIKNDLESSQDKIERFAKEYNTSMKTINNYLAFQKTLNSNAIVQNLRAQLKEHVAAPVKSLKKGGNSLQSIGLELQNTEKHSISSFAARNVMDSVMKNKKAVSSYRAQGTASIYSEFREQGIKTRTDDTLKVHNEKLSGALENSPMDLSKVFTQKEDGISSRIENLTSRTLGKRGTLDMEKARIKAQSSQYSKRRSSSYALREAKYSAAITGSNVLNSTSVSTFA